jgi:hypothetical protein
MAGGMGSGRRQSLSERTGAAQQRTLPARHCWVVDLPTAPGRWPGLLAEWRRIDPGGTWQGRTVYAVSLGSHTMLVEEWVDADYLDDASSAP